MPDRFSPVDSGWSWVILASSAMILLIQSVSTVTGVYNVIFLDVFGLSKANTSWIGAVHTSMIFLPGILAGFLSQRFGPRLTIFVGGILASLGFFLAFFSSTYIQLLLAYGVLSGFGESLIYVPGITIVGFYFKKYRNLAYGIITMSIGCGTLLWAVVTPLFVECYGWRGSMLLTSGIILNVCVFASLMRPPSILSSQEDKTENICNSEKFASNKKFSNINIDSKAENKYFSLSRQYPDIPYMDDATRSTPTLNGEDLAYHTPETMDHTGWTKSEIKHIDDYLVNNSAFQVDTQINIFKNWTRNLIQDQSRCAGLCIIQNKAFALYCISIFFLCKAYSTVMLHLPAFAVSLGTLPILAANLLSIIGITSIFSRLITGAAANHISVDLATLYFGSCGLSAIFLVVMPAFFNTYATQLAFAALFGVYSNCYVPLMAPMTIELVGVEHLDKAYGIQIFLCGVSYILGPPMAGWFYDIFESYVYGFYLTGFEFLFAAFLVMTIPVVQYQPTMKVTDH